MPHYRCCVGGCDNDSRYPEKVLKRGHVTGDLTWHYFPKDPKERALWVKNISKGLEDFVVSDYKVVCSNHFQFGKPTFSSHVPTLYLVASDTSKRSPRKRKIPTRNDNGNSPSNAPKKCSRFQEAQVQCNICFTFEQLTREHDVRFYTGLPSSSAFRLLFEQLSAKAREMHYWTGEKHVQTSHIMTSKVIRTARALTLEQELFLCLIRLRQGFPVQDLAFRFSVSESTVSSIFTTWVKFMCKELQWLILWPDRSIIQRNMPDMFLKYYPKCRVIIDCTEVYIETPSSLEIAAMCWSNYKQHYTVKFLIGITPNGAISFASPIYGGRASDAFIVKDCRFLNSLQPYDEVMADRGFKIHDLLSFHQCFLTIPPSKHTNLQMSPKEVKTTSRIANVRIYVEQAIKRIKHFLILKRELPISLLPLIDDIVIVCSSLSNLNEPLSL